MSSSRRTSLVVMVAVGAGALLSLSAYAELQVRGECVIDEDCDNGVWCTIDTCADEVCQHVDICPDDGLFCNGEEFCNLEIGDCDHTGGPPPYPEPPLVEVAGPRYIAITPQGWETEEECAPRQPYPVSFLVSSPDWPCLSKYVGGFPECGETSQRCRSDADCNTCVGGPYDGPCMSDEDCKTCTHDPALPCQTDDDCDGHACVQVQSCQISGNTCAPRLPLETIDLNDDGLDDGLVASLVADPADAVAMLPEDWGTLLYRRCSVTFTPCTTSAECDIGQCSHSHKPCSRLEQDCLNYCTISDRDCLSDNDCIAGPDDVCTVTQTCDPYETCALGKVYVTGADILPSDEGGGGIVPTRYEVVTDSGGLLSEPALVTTPLWADVDGNDVVNFADIAWIVLAFLHNYQTDVPPRTLTAVDISGSVCWPNQMVNFTDIQHAILTFKGARYNPDVLATSNRCDVPCP